MEFPNKCFSLSNWLISHWEESSSFCFNPSTRHLYTFIRLPLNLFFSRLNRTTSPVLYSHAKCFEPLIYLSDPLLHLNSSMSLSLLHWAAQDWTQNSRWCLLTSAQERGRSIPFPPAGWTLLDASQDAAGLLCCKAALLAHSQFVHQSPMDHFCQATLWDDQCPRCTSTWDDFVFPLVVLHGFLTDLFLQPVKGCSQPALNSSTTIQSVTQVSQLCAIREFAESVVRVINERVTECWSQY